MSDLKVDKELIESFLLNQNAISDVITKILDLKIEPGVGKAENGGSTMLRIRLLLDTKSGQKVRKSFMLKTKRLETSQQDLTEELCLFEIETLMYGSYLKIMQDLSRQCWDEHEWLAPKCYGFKNDLILMEDLKETGYKIIKASQGMDLDHARLVISSLAKFHALSLKLLETGSMDVNSVKPWWFHRNLSVVDNMFKGGISTFADVIEQNWGSEWKDAAYRLRKARNDLGLKLMKLSEETKGSHLQVLNHGDCWSNNVMFKYDENERLTNMRLIDYQACHFNSLCWDLTYMLYNCIFPDNRNKWIQSLLDEYSQKLSSYCSLLNYQGKIPSREEIQYDMDRVIYFGFVNSINNIPVFIAFDLPDFEFDIDQLASTDLDAPPVSHQSRYYTNELASQLLKDDLKYFMSINVI